MKQNNKNIIEEKRYEKDAGGATLENGKIVRIPAKTDFMFKNLFGINGKEENLKGLLQAILKIKIESLEIQNTELPRHYKDDKLGIVDVRAKLKDGTIAAIEMQLENQNNMGERITFYVCKLYINTIKRGQKYNTASKVIAIAITNFSYFNRKEYHQIAHLKFEKCTDPNEIGEENISEEESKEITDKLEVHIIDLQRFQKIKNPKGELADWLNLIIGNEGEIEMASQKNERIAKVNAENIRLSADKELQDMYWLEEMAIYDENTRISVATQKGEKKKQIEMVIEMIKNNAKDEFIKKVAKINEQELK